MAPLVIGGMKIAPEILALIAAYMAPKLVEEYKPLFGGDTHEMQLMKKQKEYETTEMDKQREAAGQLRAEDKLENKKAMAMQGEQAVMQALMQLQGQKTQGNQAIAASARSQTPGMSASRELSAAALGLNI